MREFKKIALKGVALIIGLAVLNFVYEATLWQSDIEEYAGVANELKVAENADILYLGDCSDSYFGSGNEHEKGISQLLDSLLPNKKVATISETGFHAGMFEAILHNIPAEVKFKTVIVTMNLRSFAAYVLYTFITNDITQRLTFLDNNYPPLLNRFFLMTKKSQNYSGTELDTLKINAWKNDHLNNAPFSTLYQWKTAYENGNYINFDKNWTTEQKEIGATHIANYAFKINTKTNPRIPNFDNIVEIAKQRNWKLIFHLLPENTQATSKLVGKELTQLINENCEFLKNRYTKNGVIVIDNLELLNAVDFIESNPNSHYYYNGRKLMAEKIKQKLK
jgi:hypothetical protein